MFLDVPPRGLAISAGISILFTIFLTYWGVSTDDIKLLMSGDAAKETADLMLRNGRIAGWALGSAYASLGIDALHQHYLFVPLLVLSFIAFAYSLTRLCEIQNDDQFFACLMAVSLAVSPAMLELLSYRHVIDIMAISLFVLSFATYLLSSKRLSRTRLVGLAAASAVATISYQPTVTAILWLVVWRGLFALLRAEVRPLSLLGDIIVRGTAVMAGALVALLGVKIVGSMTSSDVLSRFEAGPLTGAFIGDKLATHFEALSALFALPVGAYLDRLPSSLLLIYLILGAVASVVVVMRNRPGIAFKELAALSIIFALIVLLSQNPQNLLTVYYWPSLRSSFYILLLMPFCAVLAYHISPKSGLFLVFFAATSSGAASIQAAASWAEVQRRDHEIASQINSIVAELDPSGKVTKIRLPYEVWLRWPDYSSGVQTPNFNWSHSKFVDSWSRAAFIEYSTGLALKPDQNSDCGTREEEGKPPNRRSVDVSVNGDTATVCFF